MKQVFVKRGQAVVENVPTPITESGFVVIRVAYSCISSGTELSGVRNSAQPLWKRALKHPEEVRKVLDLASSQGISKAKSVVTGRLAEGLAVGYSASGIVADVASDIDDLRPGETVACAGTGFASHAEVVRVPRNLVCRVPSGGDMRVASTVALGGIAMQGIRRAAPTLGEAFVVIGLGALGQIVVQLLKANGCSVIACDVNPARVDLAKTLGADVGLVSGTGDEAIKVLRLTQDLGADGAIVTASGASDEILSTAFKLCRRKGRVVLVGDVGLSLQRQDIYEKELDFLISTSYGPGRYDDDYEIKGLTYPIGYVRWTETRNMEAYLHLAASGRLNIAPLLETEVPVGDAASAYERLKGSDAPILALLKYDAETNDVNNAAVRLSEPSASPRAGLVRLGVIGAGGFVRAVHLPNIKSLRDLFDIRAIAGRNGSRATAVARQFGAEFATTDVDGLLSDASIDAVLIGTRHNEHARMALQALRAGKAVLVEKPLALTGEELNEIRSFYESAGGEKPILLTGFNRRFSPFARRVREFTARRSSPCLLSYRMNAGYIPAHHWVHGEEGGGRNLGEACHIYDLFTYLVDEPVSSVSVEHIPPASGHHGRSDNFSASIRFADDSIATLIYTSLGNADFPKERLEAFVDGTVIVMEDYRELRIFGRKKDSSKTRIADKGHERELTEFGEGVRRGSWPIPLWQQLQASQIALDVQAQLCRAK